jgi:hypothetical protein
VIDEFKKDLEGSGHGVNEVISRDFIGGPGRETIIKSPTQDSL